MSAVSGDGPAIQPDVSFIGTEAAASLHHRGTVPKYFDSPKATLFLDWLQNSWILEYVALTLSIACLLAIFAILLNFHDKSSDTWKGALGISTVIAILTTILKASALLATASALGQLKWIWYSITPRPLIHLQTFDSASRGPFGALLLLLRNPWTMATCMGALVTLIAMGLDAAVQAAIFQAQRPQYLPTSSVPVTFTYDPHLLGDLDPLLVSAIYTGIFSARNVSARKEASDSYDSLRPGFVGQPSSITPFCSTGNCKFKPYISLAVKHRCSNITDLLQYSSDNSTSDSLIATVLIPPMIPASSSTLDVHASELSGRVTPSDPNAPEDTLISMDCSTAWAVQVANNSYYGSRHLPLAEVYMMMLSTERKTFEAVRCNLDFGMQVYTASVERGKFVETPGDFIQEDWLYQQGIGSADQASQTSILSMSATVAGTAQQIKILYKIWLMTFGLMPQYFRGWEMRSETVQASAILDTLNEMGHWEAQGELIFESIAQSVTYYLRTGSGGTAIGMTEGQEQYIQVIWPWLIVPLVLVVLNTVFVVTVHLQSHRLGLPSWRNSALALMLNDGAEDVGGMASDTNQVRVLIGPPEAATEITELESWAETQSALFKSSKMGKRMSHMFRNDSLEELG